MKSEKCKVKSAKCKVRSPKSKVQSVESTVQSRGWKRHRTVPYSLFPIPSIFHFSFFIFQFAFCVLLPVSAVADPTLNVTFPEKSGYLYWIEFKDALGKAQVTAPTHAAGAGTTIDLAPAAPAGKLSAGELKLYDPKTGNVAARSLANLGAKRELKLKQADFDRVRTVRIILRPAEGKPDERVESAVVTLKDANSDEFTAVVDPSSEGVAEFHDIAGGQETVTVAYEGGKMTVDLEVPLDRETPVFTHTLAVSAKVRTVKASTAPAPRAPGEEGAPARPEARTTFATWLPVIMAFVFLGLVGFIAYMVLKSRGATLEGSLKKLGVQFPQAEEPGKAAAPDQPVDPNICPFCGQRKDPATGNCACTIQTAPAAHHGPTAGGAPRLIGTQGPYAGQIFDLAGGETTIGRDTGNTVALADDTTASRRHATVRGENGLFTITDEGSSNGTFVNGTRITGSHPLQPGDEVQIGSTKFRFEG